MAYSVYATLFLASFALTYFFTPVIRRLAVAWDVVDHPGERKVHKAPIALMGGVGVVLSILMVIGFAWRWGFLPLQDIRPLVGIVLGVLVIFIVGVMDDLYGMRPMWKFMGQFAAAIVLVLFEVRLSVFLGSVLFDSALADLAAILVSIVWVVGITNSFNLLDNMDGLSSGVACIAGGFFFLIALQQGQVMVAVLSIALMGASLAFLRYNFSPASIFLGDAGSLTLGFLLAAISVQGIYLLGSRLTHLPVITPVLVLGVPLFDTFSVIAIRFRRGLPIFQGDMNHFSHRLVALGMTHKQAVAFIYLVAVALAIPVLVLTRVSLFEALMLLVQEFFILLIIVLLMRAGGIKILMEFRRRMEWKEKGEQ